MGYVDKNGNLNHYYVMKSLVDRDLKKNVIREAYEDPNIVASYASTNYDKGLWKSERILIQRYFPVNGHILDIGCGAGRTTIPLAQMGYRVIGVDLSFNMLEAARQKALQHDLKIDFHEMDSSALSFKDQSFDGALFSFNGIDHVPGYNGKLDILCEVFRVLRPGSNLIFSTHRLWDTVHLKQLVLGGLRMSIGRIMGLNTLEKEWGEIYHVNATDGGRYFHFMFAWRWKNALRQAGFSLVLKRSKYRIEANRTLGWIRRSLRSSNFMLYVAGKP